LYITVIGPNPIQSNPIQSMDESNPWTSLALHTPSLNGEYKPTISSNETLTSELRSVQACSGCCQESGGGLGSATTAPSCKLSLLFLYRR